MKKILFPILILGIILTISCENEPEKKEANPYPDGVYPFEVTGVSHTFSSSGSGFPKYVITWTPPADSGFSRTDVEMFMIFSNDDDEKIYPFDPVEQPLIASDFCDFSLKKDSFSFGTIISNDKYIIIKCVDKFRNISGGVRYDFSWGPTN